MGRRCVGRSVDARSPLPGPVSAGSGRRHGVAVRDRRPLMRATRMWLTTLACVAASLALAAQNRPSNALTIYIVDVEGGNAQLWVTPSGETVLVDTGNAGAAAVRDADRIMAAVKDAGVERIDHLITTHF